MPYFYYGYHDKTYIIIIIAMVISLIATFRLRGTFSKYSRKNCSSGYNGAQAAERILRNAGIYDVSIERISGDLTDHYDPRTKTLRLSDSVYGKTSIAAVGVAAHECGHAIQDAKNYKPLRLRHAWVPVANIGSNFAIPVILFGCFMGFDRTLINIGIFMFSFAVLFQLITLPVEYNASKRAVKVLQETGILYGEEVKGAKKVLSAAALTYVAATIATILQLLRLVILFGGRGRDD